MKYKWLVGYAVHDTNQMKFIKKIKRQLAFNEKPLLHIGCCTLNIMHII